MSDRPLRILHAVCTDEFAGVEQFIARLARAQAAAGHVVSVAGGDPDRMRRALPAGIRFAPVAGVAAVSRAIRSARDDTDVVNAHMTEADVAAALALVGGGRRPALVSTRHFAKRRGRFVWLDPVVRGRIDAEISISEYVAGAIGVPSTVVNPGIDSRPTAAFEYRTRTVLMAQRLQPEKHSLVGVRAFAASGLAADGWTLEVAGDGPDRAPAEELARSLGVPDAVRFLGFRDDVDQLMARASMLLATCPIEGFGLTVLEAMASGLPVVAPDTGGPAEMLAGLTARALFPADDAVAAGARLRDLAANEKDRIAFGDAVRARQQQSFTVEAQARATDAVYRAALAERQGGR